jgi:hypothetical protein
MHQVLWVGNIAGPGYTCWVRVDGRQGGCSYDNPEGLRASCQGGYHVTTHKPIKSPAVVVKGWRDDYHECTALTSYCMC